MVAEADKVRIAVAGAGQIGRRHIEEIRSSRSARLTAIADPSAAAIDLARDAGAACYGSLEELLQAQCCDGVVLATPNGLHVAQGLQCVAAGLALLVEKPIAETVADARRLVEAAESAGVPLLVGHHRHHGAVLRKAVEIVRSGVLGTIVGITGSALFYKPDEYFEGPNAWRRQPGGGPILINLIHEIGSLRAMIGEIASVQAFSSNSVRGFAVEDTAAIALRFTGGALGTFLLSDTAASPKSWEQTSGENRAYPAYPDEDACTVLGTMGSLAVPAMRLRRYGRAEDRSWYTPFETRSYAVAADDPLAQQIEHFARVIRGAEKPLVSGRDGLQNLRVTEAIVAAARTGRAVEVET